MAVKERFLVDNMNIDTLSNSVFVRSLDMLPVKQKRDIKLKVKRFLQRIRLYKSVHGNDMTRSFFPSLYADVSVASGVLFDIHCKNTDDTMDCYVNGEPVVLRRFDANWFYADVREFYSYENVVSFDRRLGVKSVEIFPLFESDVDCSNILTRNWKLESVCKDRFREDLCDWSAEDGSDYDPVLSCVLNAKNNDANSPFLGLYYPAFDVDNRTYRIHSWTWINGIIVKTLLSLAGKNKQSPLRTEAIELAGKLLNFQAIDGVVAGSYMARWDIFDQSPTGVIPVFATNDSAFLGANGLIPAYEATDDGVFLDSALRLGDWIVDKAMKSDGQLFIGYRADINLWVDDYLFVDGGFTASFFAELYRVTADSKWLLALKRFTDWFINVLYDSKNKSFWRIWYSNRSTAKELFSRGQGWALDGVISAYEVTGAERYAEVINGVADTLVQYQHTDGFWSYILDKPSSGDCSKATPILAYHLMRAYRAFGKESWFESARKAVEGCRKSVDLDKTDRRVYGGVHRPSVEGCMFGPANVDAIFMYSQCYLMLAEKFIDEHS